MNVKDIENEIMILEEKKWRDSLSESFDYEFQTQIQEEIMKYKNVKELIDKANELLEFLIKASKEN